MDPKFEKRFLWAVLFSFALAGLYAVVDWAWDRAHGVVTLAPGESALIRFDGTVAKVSPSREGR